MTYTADIADRFHVAVCLFSNRSQMMSKCGKNKNVTHETIAECVTDVPNTYSARTTELILILKRMLAVAVNRLKYQR